MKRFPLAIALALACLGGSRLVAAEERAATEQLPAALSAFAPQDARILTPKESQQVRARFIPTVGVQFVVSGTGKYANNSTVAYQFGIGGQGVNFAFTPNGLVFATQGTAAIGTNPPVQGVLAGNTNVFQGVVGFQGATSNLQVVATPDLFLVKTP